ncbi:MAG: tRNA (guanosine(46)-N7)-methyltransferase TrmB [Polynucleobacter sp.]
MDKLLPSKDSPRRIRSFVRRAGRTTLAQEHAIATLGNQFLLPFEDTLFDWSVFGAPYQDAPRIVEIGFGMGESTAQIAQVRPNDVFLGIEVHEPGVGALLKRIGEQNLSNIRLISHDAVEVLERMIAPDSLDGVHIFFPDPWHKTRHHKRRLIQKDFVELLVSKLKPNGYIHLATDWQHYAEQMLLVLNHHPQLRNQSTRTVRLEAIGGIDQDQIIGGIDWTVQQLQGMHEGFVDKPSYRPLTKFENRGLKLGHGVWDLLYRKSEL